MTNKGNLMGKTVLALFCAVAAPAALAAGPAQPAWPLVTVRHTSAVNGDVGTISEIAAIHARHPGSCDEFWFATGARKTIADVEKACGDMAVFREACDKAGILLSFQQGLTLGHSAAHDGNPAPGDYQFPDDAWQRGRDGERMGILCPRAPAVLEYEREFAKTVIRVLKPASFWLDDDLRLGIHKPDGCFCDRCIAAFNAKTGGGWTRETLVKALYSGNIREKVRAEWSAFNAESLAVYATTVRAAADELGSDCRLAYQSVWADSLYTAPGYGALLETLAGGRPGMTGIRPGAGFYTEAEPRGMVKKCLSVAREAERCRSIPAVGCVRYEEETYPRRVLHKSPGAIAVECALALASGCDSLSLYFYAKQNPEPMEEYERFAATIARARPYFERLAASTRRTRLGGVARYTGSAAGELKDFSLKDDADFDLACAGIPVTVAESGVKVWYLTEKSKAALTDADKPVLASGAVVDIGGMGKYPLASRRTKLLDDLDKATDGAFPVRVDAVRPLRILPRVRAGGALDSVTLLNLSVGETGEIAVRLRNPAGERAVLCDAQGVVTPLELAPGAQPNERVAKVNLSAWRIATIFFE